MRYRPSREKSILKTPANISKLADLEEDEKVVLLARQHWYIFRDPVLIMLFVPFLLLSLIFFLDFISLPNWLRNLLGQLSLYAVAMSFSIGFLMLVWKFYLWRKSFYLVTSRRLIFIKQLGLLSHDNRQTALGMIQDVGAQVNGIQAVLYGFGDVSVQVWTDDQPMVLRRVPHPKEIQQAIMRVAMANKRT